MKILKYIVKFYKLLISKNNLIESKSSDFWSLKSDVEKRNNWTANISFWRYRFFLRKVWILDVSVHLQNCWKVVVMEKKREIKWHSNERDYWSKKVWKEKTEMLYLDHSEEWYQIRYSWVCSCALGLATIGLPQATIRFN